MAGAPWRLAACPTAPTPTTQCSATQLVPQVAGAVPGAATGRHTPSVPGGSHHMHPTSWQHQLPIPPRLCLPLPTAACPSWFSPTLVPTLAVKLFKPLLRRAFAPHPAYPCTAYQVTALLTAPPPLFPLPVPQGLPPVTIAYTVALEGRRPALDPLRAPDYPTKLAKLVVQCWEADPRRRPAASEAVKQLVLAAQEVR